MVLATRRDRVAGLSENPKDERAYLRLQRQANIFKLTVGWVSGREVAWGLIPERVICDAP